MYNYQGYGYQPTYQQPNYMQRAYNPQPQQMAQPQSQPQVQQPMQMPQQMQPQIPIAPQVPQIQEFRHGTEDEIRPIIIYPNCVAYYIDYSKGRMYAKRADGAGMSSLEYYELTPINADGSPIKPQEPIPQVNFEEFIKKDDLEKLGFVTVSQYNELAQKLEQIQKRLEGAKQNVGQQPKQPETRV
jgi:hypothetical protein